VISQYIGYSAGHKTSQVKRLGIPDPVSIDVHEVWSDYMHMDDTSTDTSQPYICVVLLTLNSNSRFIMIR